MRSRRFPAPRELLFEAWRTAEHMKRGFSPEHVTVPRAEIDFRPGGVCRICMGSPAGQEFWSKSNYIEITRRSGASSPWASPMGMRPRGRIVTTTGSKRRCCCVGRHDGCVPHCHVARGNRRLNFRGGARVGVTLGLSRRERDQPATLT
ncbi:MAG: SRPBCC family protein [Thiobacillaceae bacterium]